MQNKPSVIHIDKFYSLFSKGLEAWLEAGKVVAEALEQDSDFADKVHQQHPEISVDTIYAFDRIGRRQLHPKLVISDAPGVKKARRLSYEVQCKVVDGTIPLLIRGKDGWDTLNVSVFNITSDQASQVFDADGIRNEGAQRAWLEDRANKIPIQVDEPYRVSGRKLVVMSPCQFTVKQLARIVADMEA